MFQVNDLCLILLPSAEHLLFASTNDAGELYFCLLMINVMFHGSYEDNFNGGWSAIGARINWYLALMKFAN